MNLYQVPRRERVQHSERLQATLLGRSRGPLRAPRVWRIGLHFGTRNPLATMWELLAAHGFADPEALRTAFPLPGAPLVCRLEPAPSRRWLRAARGRTALEYALWLGMATPWLLDPSRPVLWTRASLTRCVEVFDMEGFYA